jgi:hypothetical protein
MEKVVRVWMSRLGVALVVGLVTLASGSLAFAKDKQDKKDKEPPASAPSASTKGKPPPGESINACGCYHDAQGACACTDKKGKCDCPGDCEPVGCGEKRDKEIEREMQIEIKRAQDDEKKRQEALDAQENGKAVPDGGEAATPPPAPAKAAKAPRKSGPKAAPKAGSEKSEAQPDPT